MPKMGRDFPSRIEFAAPYEMRVRLIALGFLTGGGKQYGRIARHLLTQAIDSAVDALDPKRRQAYEEILASVKIADPESKE